MLCGRRDERFEERLVLAFLRMPEHADGERSARILDALECPVVGARRLAQAVAEPLEALVVMRLDGGASTDDRRQPGVREHLDAVLAERAGHLAMNLVSETIGEMLFDVASAGDVQYL